MSTLNSAEDVQLAELLLDLHPWAGKVRFARCGGEAMSIAVRIARAHSGRSRVAFCGYHGRHDRYIAANLADDANLDGQLLPGLKPVGVPRELSGTAIPFHYNRLDELEEVVSSQGDIGVIVLEPVRHHSPRDGFLQGVRAIADRIGAVLIFDEITSGWRMRVGGYHEFHGVYPDIVVYAKAISNGYPMAAVVGMPRILDAAEESFISSTYWTERIGPTAALATIRKLRDCDVPGHLVRVGNRIRDGWRALAGRHCLDIEIGGIPPVSTISFKHPDSRAIMTLFTQEMLSRGFLSAGTVYVSYAHNDELVDSYLENVDDVFAVLAEAMGSASVERLLRGPVAHSGFSRLT